MKEGDNMDTEIDQYDYDLIVRFFDWCIKNGINPIKNKYSKKELIEEFLEK